MQYQGNSVIIESQKDLEILLMQYSATDIDQLSSILLSDYNLVLVDRTDTGEYTQVNAQSSQDFFDEALTLSEIEEKEELNKIYKL